MTLLLSLGRRRCFIISSSCRRCAAGFLPSYYNSALVTTTSSYQGNNINNSSSSLIARRSLSDKGARPSKVVVKNKASSSSSSTPKISTERSRDLQLILSALDAPIQEEDPAIISKEEQARRYAIGRNYVVGKFRQHNEIMHDLACKLQLKQHAIRMLPKNTKLKEEALKINDEGPPLWRHFAVWTPPIQGFDPSEYSTATGGGGKK